MLLVCNVLVLAVGTTVSAKQTVSLGVLGHTRNLVIHSASFCVYRSLGCLFVLIARNWDFWHLEKVRKPKGGGSILAFITFDPSNL